MRRPTRIALYGLLALVLGYATMIVLEALDPCTDLDSDCDLGAIEGVVWAVIVVCVVMPVLVIVTEAVAKHRGWDVTPGG